MDDTGLMMTTKDPADSDLIVRRLFKVAEILSRISLHENATDICHENDSENHEMREVGYCESGGRFNNT